jgi:DNA-binding FrmR family transcriptional regulator
MTGIATAPQRRYTRAMASHTHTHSPEEKKALQTRLRKIAGQIAGIERMIEADRDCPEVLTQVVSVRKALKSFAQVVIHQHAHHCIEGAAEPREAQRKLRELLVVLERFVE